MDVSDVELTSHAERAKGKVVLITGGASGIGRQMALQFASYGAKVVIGDIQTDASNKVVEEIKAAGGEAVFQLCDVTEWEQQHALFKFAISTYGAVDYVIPNAGVTEGDAFMKSIAGSEPIKPNLKTIEINLTAVVYTCQLAVFYFGAGKHAWNKALIIIGSIASLWGIPMGLQYSSAKHGLIGVMGSLYHLLHGREIRIGVVAPFFADTAILDVKVKTILAGVPYANLQRISGSAVAIATYHEPDTNGCVWTIPDDKTVFRLNRDNMAEGGYKILMARVERLFVALGFFEQSFKTMSDLFGLISTSWLVFAVAVAFGAAVWKQTVA